MCVIVFSLAHCMINKALYLICFTNVLKFCLPNCWLNKVITHQTRLMRDQKRLMRDQKCFKAVLKVVWCEIKSAFSTLTNRGNVLGLCVRCSRGVVTVYLKRDQNLLFDVVSKLNVRGKCLGWGSLVNLMRDQSGCSTLSLRWTAEALAKPYHKASTLFIAGSTGLEPYLHPFWWWDQQGRSVLPSSLMVRSNGMEGASILSDGEIKWDGGCFHPLWWWDQPGWNHGYINSDARSFIKLIRNGDVWSYNIVPITLSATCVRNFSIEARDLIT